ncbi:MAG TPA: VTT domain-containing protein [Burkholderiales bacterium]|nr:VTT domain-containing protein [Burkholderiales bacterium]
MSIATSIFQPGRNCGAVAHADRVALLVDAEQYFRAFARAAENARYSIVILAWDFDSRIRLHWDPGRPPSELGPFLNWLVRRRRSLHVRVLDWDYPMVFGTDREFPPIYGFGWKPRRRVHLRYDNTHPVGGSQHQKIVVIDDALAFCGGLDLADRHWDTCEHRANDPRRTSRSVPYPPFHDVMCAVDGEAARQLAQLARDRWLRATGEPIPPLPGGNDPWPTEMAPQITDVRLGISRTAPKADDRPEVREVERLYADMIARARQRIYIENQYFTADSVGEALAARLAEKDGPEIVLVLRLLSHGWLEEHTMHILRTRLLRKLREIDREGRFHVYYPDIRGLAQGTCIDVHSKVMVVDDEWLRIGSANLSNRSMGLDVECDLTFEARGEARIARPIAEFRHRLLGEHLGVAPSRVAREIERAGSMHAAIAALHNEQRTLRPLEDVPEWSEAVIEVASVADPERPVSLDQLIDEFTPDLEMPPEAGVAWAKIAIAAVAIGALTALWHLTPLQHYLTAERVMALAEDFSGRWWAPVAVVLAYTPACIVMFPRPVITLFAVVAFGAGLGFAFAMAGILLAATATYYAGRYFDRDTVRRIAGERLNRVSEVLRQRGLLAVTAVRFVPLAPFAIESLVAGAIRIKLWHVLAGTFLGMLPGTLTATVFGDQIQTALRDPERINYWIVGAVIAFFIFATLAVRRWLYRTQLREHQPARGHGMPRHASR